LKTVPLAYSPKYMEVGCNTLLVSGVRSVPVANTFFIFHSLTFSFPKLKKKNHFSIIIVEIFSVPIEIMPA
jgi:hypothetical protein